MSGADLQPRRFLGPKAGVLPAAGRGSRGGPTFPTGTGRRSRERSSREHEYRARSSSSQVRGMTATGWKTRGVLLGHIALGGILGILILHPVSMAIQWVDLYASGAASGGLGSAVVHRLATAFSVTMLPMTGLFALLGAAVGAGFGLYHRARVRAVREETFLARELHRDFFTLLRLGEGEQLEFKASARWDVRRNAPSRDVEHALAKTIAGFLNHEGGNVLVGVDDRGDVVGLQPDYRSLRRKNADGLQQFIVGLVRTRLGGDVCPLVHVAFHAVDEEEVCRILVEPSPVPVYYRNGGSSSYFVRTGNGTRELDARETVEHIRQRAQRQGR